MGPTLPPPSRGRYFKGNAVAEPLDPNDLVTLDELALSNMWKNAASVEVLECQGVLTKPVILGRAKRQEEM